MKIKKSSFIKFALFNMELLNSISSRGLKRLEFLYGFYPYFQFYKRLFMSRLEFSCFDDIFVRIFKTREEYGAFPAVEGTVKSMEQKTRVFCKIDVQEFISVQCAVLSFEMNTLTVCQVPGSLCCLFLQNIAYITSKILILENVE